MSAAQGRCFLANLVTCLVGVAVGDSNSNSIPACTDLQAEFPELTQGTGFVYEWAGVWCFSIKCCLTSGGWKETVCGLWVRCSKIATEDCPSFNATDHVLLDVRVRSECEDCWVPWIIFLPRSFVIHGLYEILPLISRCEETRNIKAVRGGSEVGSVGFPCKGLELSSRHPYNSSESPVTKAADSWHHFLVSGGIHKHSHRHTHQ